MKDVERSCKKCMLWVKREDGAFFDEVGDCHLEPRSVETPPDYWCSKFVPKPEPELKPKPTPKPKKGKKDAKKPRMF